MSAFNVQLRNALEFLRNEWPSLSRRRNGSLDLVSTGGEFKPLNSKGAHHLRGPHEPPRKPWRRRATVGPLRNGLAPDA
jgi:hypothetical protein